MAPIKAPVFQRVRKKLDENGYLEPLPPEAVPLAQRLLEDLLKISRNFNQVEKTLIDKTKVKFLHYVLLCFFYTYSARKLHLSYY